MKKSRNDSFKTAINSYLECRNYPDIDTMNMSNNLNQSAEEMAVASIVQYDTSKTNSILFSCINNDPTQYDVQYNKLYNFIKDFKIESVKNELMAILSPLLCHLYLEMLRGGHSNAAQTFLKKYSICLPQKDMPYHQPLDGNLPSALYRPNSLEQLFNTLHNGAIDNDTPERDLMNQILDEIASIYSLQDVESKPCIALFRSCQYDITLSQEALNVLKSYLAKQGHVLLMQVLKTWFHIEVIVDSSKKDDEDDNVDENNISYKLRTGKIDKFPDTNDIFLKCNGHAESQEVNVDEEIRELQDAIKSLNETLTPLKLYKIAAPDSHLICAKTDHNCRILCGGFSNSEVRLWDLGDNIVNRFVNKNISEVGLACNLLPDPVGCYNTPLQIGTGIPLRGHSGPVQAVNVLDKEEIILTASHDNTMRAWRLSDYSCASIYRGHNYPIWCMDVSRNSIFIITGSNDKTAKLWSLDRTFPIRVFAGHLGDVTCVKFHPNETYVATGSTDRSIRLWTVDSARLVRVLSAHKAVVRALSFAPQGDYLASAGDDKKIRVWDLAASTCIHEYRGHNGKVTALDWSAVAKGTLTSFTGVPDGHGSPHSSLLCSAGIDAYVNIWDNQIKSKLVSNQDVISTTYNTKCTYLVDVQVHPDWVVAIGTVR